MKPKSDEDETALFREAIRDVKPLASTPRVTAQPPKPRARARFARAERRLVHEATPRDGAQEPELAAGDSSRFARPGVPETTLRKMRRGQIPVQAELDLHGLTQAEAKALLHEFLNSVLQRDVRCLRIVHGKGLRSGGRGAVLRQLVNGELRRIAQVLAFASARPADGGTGALYVLLAGRS